MSKYSVPNAWDDDDWEAQADRLAAAPVPQEVAPEPPLTRKERLAQHTEANRKLWESADTPEPTLHYVEANGGVPLTTSFKPQVKVLSRKPVIARRGFASGMSLDDDDDEGSQQEAQLSPEEIRAKQKKDREEKQRRYEEARAKIFGESVSSSRGSSPGTVTPPRSDGRNQQTRGRGRGGTHRGNNTPNAGSRQSDNRRQNSNQSSGAPSTRELYDPSYSLKSDAGASRHGGGDNGSPARAQPAQNEQQAIRSPRGPDGSGRGGFGFARRGARES